MDGKILRETWLSIKGEGGEELHYISRVGEEEHD